MPIDTEHPQYRKYARRWQRMEHALEDEETLKDITLFGCESTEQSGTLTVTSGFNTHNDYIPKTTGMAKLQADGIDPTGEAYKVYVNRARFPAITHQALTGIVGLVFEKDPLGADDTIITNTGQSNGALARDVVSAVSTKGLDVLVVDAPEAGGTPYITTYQAECRINWRSRNEEEPTLTVLRETVPAETNDDYEHDTDTVYREYRRLDNGSIQMSRYKSTDEGGIELITDPIILPIKTWPIITPGAIDLKPRIDPIPLLPVARCALAFFRKSAVYEQAVFMCSQPQPWFKCVDKETYNRIMELGTGPTSGWNLGESPDAECGYLQVTGKDIDKMIEGMKWELDQAETYAVRLTQNTGSAEAASALAMRQATQHASIYTIAKSVSLAITRAQEIRAEWGGFQVPEPFEIQTEFSAQYASEQLIRAVNEAINAGNLPQSVMFELARRGDLTNKSDEDLLTEMENQSLTGGNALAGALGSGNSASNEDAENEDETANA